MSEAERYLTAVVANASGPGAARLAAELRDHIDDALADGATPTEVVERLGRPEDALAAWRSLIRKRRADSRRRAALLVFAVAIGSALGVVQHASGNRAPHATCPVSHPGTPVGHGHGAVCQPRP